MNEKPSLLGLLAAVNASKQSPSDHDDAPDDDHDAPPGVAAAQSFLDACDDDDPEALADAMGAFLDMHHAADDAPPSKPTTATSDRPSLTVHIHASKE